MTQPIDLHQIGKYRILEEIGRGGMAVVYKGYDADLERVVAIKALPEAYTNDPQFVQRFQQEARLAARLHHPNIVTIHDVGQQGNLYYIVMQYLPGLNLDQIVNAHGPVPLKTAAAITYQIAAALDHAHERGMAHRDVKPSNIMLSPEGQVTLMDFGLVRAGESSAITRMGTVVGTPEYMSPEQAQGKQVDSRTDIYSLGVVLYKMLSGVSPYARSTPLATLLAQVTDPLPLDGPLARLPREVKRVLQKALAKSPADRYQSAGALAADLLKVTGVQPSTRVRLPLPPAPSPQRPAEAPRAEMPETYLLKPPGSPEDAGQPVATARPSAPISDQPISPQPSVAPRPRRNDRKALWVALAPIALILVAGLIILPRILNGPSAAPAAPAAVVASPTQEAPAAKPMPIAADTAISTPASGFSLASEPTATATSAALQTPVIQIVVVTATPVPATISPPTVTPIPATAVTTPTPVPTRAPTATPVGLATPALLSPNPNADITGKTRFAWSWSGPALAENQGFEVRIWRDNQQVHYGAAAPVRSTSAEIDVNAAYGVTLGGTGSYLWTVAVVQLEPYQSLGPEAAPRALLIHSSGASPPGNVCPPGGC